METKYGLTLWQSLILPLVPIIVGSAIREWKGDPHWYRTLNKSNYHPQEALIVLLWLFFFPALGLSYFLVQESYITEPYSRLEALALITLIFYGVMLLLNGLWYYGFFYLNSLRLSFYLSLGKALLDNNYLYLQHNTNSIFCFNFLVLTVITTTVLILSSCVNFIAGIFALPYTIWVIFTTCLSWSLIGYNESSRQSNNSNNVYAPLLA
jgi:tryptophan-rich sensory protein